MSTQESQNRIEKVIDLAAPIARVWNAISDHTEFEKWFHVRFDGPFEVGAATTGTITYPGYEHMKWESVTERMESERLFAFSWHPSAVAPDATFDADAMILVEFHLAVIERGTRLTIVESGFEHFPEAVRPEVLRSNIEGWNIQANNIAAYVEQA